MLSGRPSLAAMLPPAQLMAAPRISNRPSTVVVPSVCMPMVAMPAVASSSANHWKGCTRSPLMRMDRPMVKNTWVCTTSEAMPGEIWPLMPRYKSPNWPTPISNP